MFVEPRANVQKKLTCIKIEHGRDKLNQARNLNRTSKQTNNNINQKLKEMNSTSSRQQQRRRQRQKYKQTIIIFSREKLGMFREIPNQQENLLSSR